MGIKISELNEITEINNNDLIPIVDVENEGTKKVTKENLFKDIALEISEMNEKMEAKMVTGEEFETNELIDGKRVYVKNINFTMPNSVSTWGFIATIGTQSKLIAADLFVAPSNEVYRIPHARGGETMSFYYNKGNGNLYVDANYSYPLGKNGWGTVKYIKNG